MSPDYSLKTRVDTKGTAQYLPLTIKRWVQALFQHITNEQACMFRSS